MESASNSKKIMEVESEMRSRIAFMGQRNFAKEAGWHESKVSRLNVTDMATAFVILDKAWHTSLIHEVAKQAVESVRENCTPEITLCGEEVKMLLAALEYIREPKEKAPSASTDRAVQNTVHNEGIITCKTLNGQ